MTMSMDGAARSSQLMPYTDTLGNLGAAERALEERRHRSDVNHDDTEVQRVVNRKNMDDDDDPKKRRRAKAPHIPPIEAALENMLLKEFGIELDPNEVYLFDYNDKTDQIELKLASSGKLLLSMEPERFITLSQRQQAAGILRDWSA